MVKTRNSYKKGTIECNKEDRVMQQQNEEIRSPIGNALSVNVLDDDDDEIPMDTPLIRKNLSPGGLNFSLHGGNDVHKSGGSGEILDSVADDVIDLEGVKSHCLHPF